MISYIQAGIMTLVEALCCKIFFDIFLEYKNKQKRWKSLFLFGTIYAGFMWIALITAERFILKAVLAVTIISIYVLFQYETSVMQTIFLTVAYYGILISIDKIMLLIVSYIPTDIWKCIVSTSTGVIILGLMCKMILLLCIILLNCLFRPHGSFQMIKDREWIRFLIFPISTIVCMVSFTRESEQVRNSELIVAFVLVLLNFLVFYIIRDVVYKEEELQEVRLLQERTKNQMNVYQYMESVYGEQRKKVHDFKNSMECIRGLLKSNRYEEAQEYLGQMTENWIEEIDYINTNHPIVDSIINQKFKQAKRKGIPLLLSINDLRNLKMEDEDIVILLGNLLDNAIEASEKVEINPKWIKVRFLVQKENIIISVRNPVSELIKMENGKIISTKNNKEEHGIGLKNIKSVVDKYGGDSIYSCNNGFFTYTIEIPFSKDVFNH